MGHLSEPIRTAEMAPHSVVSFDLDPSEMTWDDRIRHSKFFRLAVKKSYGDSMSSLQIVQVKDTIKPVLFGLGGGDQQCIISSEIPDIQLGSFLPEIWLKPLFGPDQLNEQATPSAEAQLFCERMRSHVVSGLTGFSWHSSSESLLLSSFNRLKMLSVGFIFPSHVSEYLIGVSMFYFPKSAKLFKISYGNIYKILCKSIYLFVSERPM